MPAHGIDSFHGETLMTFVTGKIQLRVETQNEIIKENLFNLLSSCQSLFEVSAIYKCEHSSSPSRRDIPETTSENCFPTKEFLPSIPTNFSRFLMGKF